MGSRDVRRLSDDVTKGLYCLPIQLRHRAHILHVLESDVRGFRDVFACVHFICTNSLKLDRPRGIRTKIAHLFVAATPLRPAIDRPPVGSRSDAWGTFRRTCEAEDRPTAVPARRRRRRGAEEETTNNQTDTDPSAADPVGRRTDPVTARRR